MRNHCGVLILSQPVPSWGSLFMSRVVKRSVAGAIKTGEARGRQDATSSFPRWIPPQLCQLVDKAPSGPQWLHEIKLDGFRMAARIEKGRVQLLTRTGLDWSEKYPSIVTALANVKAKTAYIDGELCGIDDAGLPSFAHTQAATDGEREVQLVYYAFDLLHLDGRDVSGLPLNERKSLLEPLIAGKPGLQFNGHETGDGELILRHAGRLGFEGVVSKTIGAPYVPGNRGLWRKAKWLNRQEFVVVGWSDPEGSRPHLGALLLGYYTDDGKLIYAGRVARACPTSARRFTSPPGPLSASKFAAQRAAVTQDSLRIAPRSLSGALGRAEACRRDHLFDLDGRQPLASHRLRRPPRGQTGGSGAARSRTRLIRGRGQGSINQRQSGVDGLCGKTRKMTGRENLDFARQTSSARVIVTMRLMGGPHGATSPARPNPCRIFHEGRLWPFKL
jgi:DNA ligase D-like protein (predicted ligase)